MPYNSPEELPPQVKNHLPPHAQHIFVKAFNNAYQEYADPKNRRDPNDDPEVTAFRVAWSAVKKEYHKDGFRWVRNHDQSSKRHRAS